ncbi:MAG: magnesium transporter [bacterium]|nr:magnesium transporter [bacterium]
MSLDVSPPHFEDRVRALLAKGDTDALHRLVRKVSTAEIEEAFEFLDTEECQLILDILDTETAAEVLGGVDEHIQEDLTDALSERKLADLVEEMDSDEAADTVRLLEDDEQERVLDLLEDETEEEVRTLLQHEEDTAGDLMMVELAAIHEQALVAEAIEMLRENADDIKRLYNVYVVDSERRLKGELPLRDMVLARPGMPLQAVMSATEAWATPGMDQEEVANLFRKYDLVSLPVIDGDDKLVGRITVDDVLDVMEEEASEDLSRLAGLGSEDSFHALGIFRLSRERLPWLILGLGGGLVSGRILQGFETSLSTVLELAFFVPVIMALAGNIGIQSSTIIVRGLATGEVKGDAPWPRIRREILVSIFNGAVIGMLTFGVVWFWLQSLPLALLISSTMMLVVLWATLTGTVIPMVFTRFGIDPAYATGPFVTTTNDIVALTIYLAIAWRFRHILV